MRFRLLNRSWRLAGLSNRNPNWASPSLFGQSLVLSKCKPLSVAAPALPTVVLDKKSLGKITLRQMSKRDLNGINELIKARKLIDFCESDINSVFQSPDFLGVVAESEAHEIVGFYAWMQYDGDFVIGGHQVVEESLRKKNLGIDITQYAENVIGNTPAYGFGFGFLEQYYERVRGYLDREYGAFYKLVGTFNKTYIQAEAECGADILKADEVDFNDLFLYDQSIHTKPRHSVLHATCFHPKSTGYVAVRGGKVVGYAVLRECYLSFKIAPLFADDPGIAHALYQKVAAQLPNSAKLCLFVSSRNDYIPNFIAKNEFEVTETLWRIVAFTRRPVNISVNFNKVFCLTDPNFAMC